MYRNVAGQKWVVFAFDRQTSVPKTGDAANITANIRIDGGTANPIDDLNPAELEGGYYIFDITQVETNGELVSIHPSSTTAYIQVVGVPGTYSTDLIITEAIADGTGGRVSSVVDICSLALMNLGADSITSIDDATTRAKLCRSFYPNVRDAVLRAYPWNCARYSQVLALLSSTPVNENWASQFTLPINPYCLWVPKFMNEDLIFEINGRSILTDETAVTLNYIRRVVDPGLFDSLLVDAIVARLSHQLAYPLTGVASTTELMWKLYTVKLQEARTIDGMENGQEQEYESNSLIDVR